MKAYSRLPGVVIVVGALILKAIVVTVLIVSLAGSGCAPRGALPLLAPGSTREGPAWVQVTNQNWSDLRVYVVRNGQRVRLGTVTSMQTERFEVPRTVNLLSGDVGLLVIPIGGSWVQASGALLVNPGQTVMWEIGENPALSMPIVR